MRIKIPLFPSISLLLLLVVILSVIFLPAVLAQQTAPINGIYLDEPQSVVSFKLVDQDKHRLTRKRFKGQWDILYFGYTYCPDVCPLALSQMNAAQKQLQEQGWQEEDINVWLISVDPKRDTPERLKEYVSFFNTNFQAASGEREEIDKLAQQMGINYEILKPEPGESEYLVAHTSTLVVINPNAEIQAVLTELRSPAEIAQDLAYIRNQAQL